MRVFGCYVCRATFDTQDMLLDHIRRNHLTVSHKDEAAASIEKRDAGKLRFSLLPLGAIRSVVKVLEFGAAKYAPDAWQNVPDARRRYYDSAMRHLDAYWSGEGVDDENDAESGLPHLAHAACCVLFLLWFSDRDREATR